MLTVLAFQTTVKRHVERHMRLEYAHTHGVFKTFVHAQSPDAVRVEWRQSVGEWLVCRGEGRWARRRERVEIRGRMYG